MAWRTALYRDTRCLLEPVGRTWRQAGIAVHALDAEEKCWRPSVRSRGDLLALLQASGLSARLQEFAAPMVEFPDLLRVHSPGYLNAFQALSDAGGGELGDCASFDAGGFEIARRSAGQAIGAVDAVLSGRFENSYALCWPGGHHCLPEMPMGSCLLANIPIALEVARGRYGVDRIAVVDWDAHHGNGTQSIFYERADVLTISIHQEGCFPAGYAGVSDRGSGAGYGYNLNVPLLPGGGHDSYVYAMDRVVGPALKWYRPELIVVACGLNANALEPSARMQLHSDSFRKLTAQAMDFAAEHCSGRLALIQEGGESEVLVPLCGHAVIETLVGVSLGLDDATRMLVEAQQPNARFVAFQRELIDQLASCYGH